MTDVVAQGTCDVVFYNKFGPKGKLSNYHQVVSLQLSEYHIHYKILFVYF